MTRWIALAALLCPGSAVAGGYLAGGLMGSPTPTAGIAVGAPAFRVGLGAPELAGWLSVQGVRVHLDSPELNAWGLQPALGLRARVGKGRTDAVVAPLLTAGTYTRLWGLSTNDPNLEPPPEQDADAGLRPVIGGIAGTGLDARLSPNLSLAAEVGIDAFTAGYQFEGWVSQGQSLSTWSAVTVNLWL